MCVIRFQLVSVGIKQICDLSPPLMTPFLDLLVWCGLDCSHEAHPQPRQLHAVLCRAYANGTTSDRSPLSPTHNSWLYNNLLSCLPTAFPPCTYSWSTQLIQNCKHPYDERFPPHATSNEQPQQAYEVWCCERAWNDKSSLTTTQPTWLHRVTKYVSRRFKLIL